VRSRGPWREFPLGNRWGGGDGNRTRVQGFAGLEAYLKCYQELSQCTPESVRTGMLPSPLHKRRKALYIRGLWDGTPVAWPIDRARPQEGKQGVTMVAPLAFLETG
jgi:hypothetical protein